MYVRAGLPHALLARTFLCSTRRFTHTSVYRLGHLTPRNSLPTADMSNQTPQSIDAIFENNKKWVSSKKNDDPAFFEKLAAGQTPDYL